MCRTEIGTSLITGEPIYSSRYCVDERRGFSVLDWFLGGRKDRCGPEGRNFVDPYQTQTWKSS